MAKLTWVDPSSFVAMELDMHLLNFTKLSRKFLDFYFLVGTNLTTAKYKQGTTAHQYNPCPDDISLQKGLFLSLRLHDTYIVP